jgi:hypothetical protein
MPTDFTSTDSDPISTESPMFAPVPAWERGKKRRSFGSRGSRVAPEPRSFAAELSADPELAPATVKTRPVVAQREEIVDLPDETFAAAPVFASSTAARKGNGAAPIAIAAGLILIGGLAAAGWYATQPHDQGVAELTPGASSTTTTGDTTTAVATAPAQVAQNTAPTPPPVAAKPVTTTTVHSSGPTVSRTTVARARPAPRSAADVGSDASTRASAPPPMPMPTPAPAPAAAAPAPLVLNIPQQAAPVPTAPAETPQPTQTAPAPAPTQTPPSN